MKINDENIRESIRFALASSRLLLVALVLVIAVTLATALSASIAQANAGDRPFKGVMENNDTIVSDYYPGTDPITGAFQLRVDIEIDGAIHATHLGEGTVDGFVTINIWPLLSGGCSTLVAGTIDFIAANGDELNMKMTVNELCAATGQFTGEYEIEGGTGRFDSADGLIGVTSVLISGEPSVNTLSGTIVY